jgi:hypothetical protein
VPLRQDPRTSNWYFRKSAKLPSGNRERIFDTTDEAGQPFKREKDSDEAERAAIELLEDPEQLTDPTDQSQHAHDGGISPVAPAQSLATEDDAIGSATCSVFRRSAAQ